MARREDLRLEKKGLPGDMLTRHGNFSGPRDAFYSTINQLTCVRAAVLLHPGGARSCCLPTGRGGLGASGQPGKLCAGP